MTSTNKPRQRDTLNNKIEIAWMRAREVQPEGRAAKHTYQLRFIHIIADELGTTIERVRQRIAKIERRETGAPHCATCTCAEVASDD